MTNPAHTDVSTPPIPVAPVGTAQAVIDEAESSDDGPRYQCAVVDGNSRQNGVRRFNAGVRVDAPAISKGAQLVIRSFGCPSVQEFRRRIERDERAKLIDLDDDDKLPPKSMNRVIRETALRTVMAGRLAVRLDGAVRTASLEDGPKVARDLLRDLYFPGDESAHDYKILAIIQSLHDEVESVPFERLAELPPGSVLTVTELVDDDG